jgi:hypothetical protein
MYMTRLKEIQRTVWHQEQPGKMFHMSGYVLFAGLQKVILLESKTSPGSVSPISLYEVREHLE